VLERQDAGDGDDDGEIVIIEEWGNNPVRRSAAPDKRPLLPVLLKL
jgi:hypothetical protein